MKNIFFLLSSIIYISNYTHAQDSISQFKNFTDEIRLENDKFIIMPFNEDSSKIQYYQVVNMPNYTKAELYDLLYKWSIQNYPFKEKPFSTSDDPKEQVFVRGSIPVHIGNPRTEDRELYYVLELSAKEGKYRILFKNFYLAEKKNAKMSVGFFGGISISESKITEYELENFYWNEWNRKPRQLVFKEIHEGIVAIKDLILSNIKKDKDW
ncbi:MAG: DUF4468 domain-containing protein [Chitinophagales bacterium]